MNSFYPVMNLFSQAPVTTVPIESYQVANLMREITTYAQNGKAIAAMVALSKNDPASYAATMGDQADAFLSTVNDSDAHAPDIQAFQAQFAPVGAKNQIEPAMLASVNAWIADQGALSGFLQDHPPVSAPAAAPGAPGALPSAPIPSSGPSPAVVGAAVVVGGGSILYLVARKIFFKG